VLSVAFSSDGDYIASGSYNTIRVWDVSILRAAYGGSSPPLHAQAEEVELGVIREDSEFEGESGE
jgi:WD40 repeat protein